MNAPHRQQKGMALILALFIVVLVTTIVVSVSWRFQLSMARNENRWHGAQARAYLEGSEQLARQVLIEDAQLGKVDYLGEMWAQTGDPLPTDEGWIRGKIEDAHSRFNLNLLISPKINPEKPPLDISDKYNATQRRFIRFLQMIELETGPMDVSIAMEIADALSDWLDGDSQLSGYGGAEKDYYENLDPPILISNEPMKTVSELLLVKGVTPEIYDALLPYIIALPESVKMNINTVHPAILRAFNRKDDFQPLTEGDWEALVQERNMAEEGFKEVKAFADSPVIQSLLGDEKQFDTKDLTVSSEFFLFFSETLVGEQVRRGKTLLYRNNGNVDIIRRTDANF